jgi:putative membrane protein
MNEDERKTIDSKYIQQHLANERTFLAWVRTALALVGVGFLITNLHFSTQWVKLEIGDNLAKAIGICSIVMGVFIVGMAKFSYFKKSIDINEQTLRFSKTLVLFLAISSVLVMVVFGFYFVLVWETAHEPS